MLNDKVHENCPNIREFLSDEITLNVYQAYAKEYSKITMNCTFCGRCDCHLGLDRGEDGGQGHCVQVN